VDAAYSKAVELGSDVIFEPQLFPKYHNNYYAAYWHDPHGFIARNRLSQGTLVTVGYSTIPMVGNEGLLRTRCISDDDDYLAARVAFLQVANRVRRLN
jgi:hypothetical protein